jgi:hypothetical protein
MIKKMKRIRIYISFFLLFFLWKANSTAQDSLIFSGQLSAYSLFNPAMDLSWNNGGRYLPQINYEYNLKQTRKLDMELSANIYGNAAIHPFDTASFDGGFKAYRVWTRYSSRQFELRLGLQKINFGSATILRPLMWFDKIDPRDPLQLTDGVWALLAKYYFLDNTNIWFWTLYGNKELKAWELTQTNQKYPEFGGRIQRPVPKGEAAITYHHRVSDAGTLDTSFAAMNKVAENRFAFDGKWDLKVGLFCEAVWIHNNKDIGNFSNQHIFNAGIDYTFAVGKGLYLSAEQLMLSYTEKAFNFNKNIYFSGFSCSYPIGLLNTVSSILYYDWENENIYSFLNFKREYDNISLLLMAYYNPTDYEMPFQQGGQNYFAGKGIQLMLIYNH